MSRVYPTQFSQEEPLPIKEPPTTITRQTLQQTQVEASHEMITEGLVATYGQVTNTEMEADTPLLGGNYKKSQESSSSQPPQRQTETRTLNSTSS